MPANNDIYVEFCVNCSTYKKNKKYYNVDKCLRINICIIMLVLLLNESSHKCITNLFLFSIFYFSRLYLSGINIFSSHFLIILKTMPINSSYIMCAQIK